MWRRRRSTAENRRRSDFRRVVCAKLETQTGHWHASNIGTRAATDRCEKWSVADVRAAMSAGVVFYTCDDEGKASLISAYDCFCGYCTIRTPVDAVPENDLQVLPTCTC
jgi:hypothetical protein